MANPLPSALSPSRLQDFQSCPRKFQHAAVDRIPQPATYATLKGNFVHQIFEDLFKRPAAERSAEAATSLIGDAEAAVLTDQAVADVGLDESGRERLREETRRILDAYSTMEDPSSVKAEGVELVIRHEVDGVPMMGILDRLDREDDGSLSIVDYKTGGLPNRDFDSKTFANTELYAALCQDDRGELPKRIRLLYVSHGQAIERAVTEPVVAARRRTAAAAWSRITAFHEAGTFPATPSRNACRFCGFRELCRANGVKVPD
jgi:putative RecB family exonuclease